MYIDLTLTANQTIPVTLTDKTAIVIDVLRATSTIVTALAHGCHAIIPVTTTQEALQKAATANQKKTLLGGEGHGNIPPGFHLGNSPREYAPSIVTGKTIIFTTTNGTKAITNSRPAQQILISSLLNAQATAYYALEAKRDLQIICAGTRGKFSLEDTLAAGLIIRHIIQKSIPHPHLSDLARMAYHLYITYHNHLLYPLQNSTNGRNLTKLGFRHDIRYCAQVDKYQLVPIYKDGIITAQ